MMLPGTDLPLPRLRVRYLGRTAYHEALARQEAVLRAKIEGEPADELLLLEHDPVYTLGRGAREEDLQGAPARLGVPVYRVGRGGGATYHGPGQLVAYPIVRLRPTGRDVHRFIRSLEDVLIATCARFSVHAQAREGWTGVWVEDRKIASIGIGVRRGISFHGTALNVSTDARYFSSIVVCRAADTRITTLEAEAGQAPAVSEVAAVYRRCFAERLGYEPGHVEIAEEVESSWRPLKSL